MKVEFDNSSLHCCVFFLKKKVRNLRILYNRISLLVSVIRITVIEKILFIFETFFFLSAV